MALISSSPSCSLNPNFSLLISRSSSVQGLFNSSPAFLIANNWVSVAVKRTLIPNAVMRKDGELHEPIKSNIVASGNEWNRRDLLFQAVLASSAFPLVANAADTDLPEKFRVYTDEGNMFTINIPEDWQQGAREDERVRSVIAFYPPEATNSNISIVIKGLGADFTKLASFGKVDEFAENLVGGLDRSWQRPPGVAAKLTDSKAANGLYYIEYTLKNPGENRRNLLTVLGISKHGFYNRLFTLTGQFVDEE